MEDQFFIKCNHEDISSFANFQEFKQTHIHINNKIDFENSKYNIINLFLFQFEIYLIIKD